jgi:hypothetical protein
VQVLISTFTFTQTKLERYDKELQESDPSKFNQDQLKALQKKNDVRAVIEELEDMLSQFATLDAEVSCT